MLWIFRPVVLLAAIFLASLALAQPSSNSPLAPPANGPRRADPTWHALFDCTLHPKPGESIEHATVVVRDGRITAILPPANGPDGRPAAAKLPIGPRAWDCKGLHVYPAFIEPYADLDVPAPAQTPGTHWNPKISPQRRAVDAAATASALADSLRPLGFGAAAIVPNSGIFRGWSAVISLAKPATEPSAAKPPIYTADVFQAVAFESGGGYPGSEMGAIAVVRQTFLDAQWAFGGDQHAPDPEADFNCLAQIVGSSMTDKSFFFNANSELQMLRYAKIAKEMGTSTVYVGSGTEFQRLPAIVDMLKSNTKHHAGPSLVLPLNFPKAPDVASVGAQEGTDLRELMAWEQAPTNPRRLAVAGIEFALTTHRLRDRYEFKANLQSAIKHGYSEDAALAALTTIPATLLGVDKDLGTVEVGKRANLLVTDGPVFAKKNKETKKDVKFRDLWIDGIRHELNAAPAQKLEGTWKMEIPGAPAAERSLVFEADNSITIHRGDKKVKASKSSVGETTLSFVFDYGELGEQKGYVTMTGVIEVDDAGRPATLVGQGIWIDGAKMTWSAVRQPPSLEGFWPVIFDQAMPNGNRVANPIAFDKDNKIVFPGMKDKDGNAITVDNFAYDGKKISYSFDQGRLGMPNVEGVVNVSANIDWNATPPTMTGSVESPNGKFTWKSARRDANPFVGTWRVTKADDAIKDPAAKEGLTIAITKDSLTLTFTKEKGDDLVIKATDVKYENGKLTFSHPLEKLGGGKDDKSSDVLTFEPSVDAPDKDEFAGESTLPDGGKHTYRAARQKKDDADDDDDESIKDIPEALPTPFGAYGLTEQPAQETILLSNATIWTLGPSGTIQNGWIVVSGGKIRALGSGSPNWSGPEATTIDLKGKFVTPGIIDAHSHTGISGGVNEAGQAITSEVRIQDVTNPDDIDWYRQLAGGVTCVLNLHGSANAIGGQSQTNKLRWGCAHPDEMHVAGAKPGIKFALGENPRQANGQGSDRYPQTRMGVETLIRDRFAAAKEYAATMKMGGVHAPRRDLELEALAEILAGERLVHCHSYRQDEIVMLCHVAKDYGFKIGTFQHILEGYKVADFVRDYSGGGSGFSDWWAYKLEVQDAIPAGLTLMHEVGCVMSFNSDSDEMARRMNVEAAKAVKYGGLSEEDAFKFVSLNAAKQLKIDHQTGSLEVGKDADLVIWSGNPLSAFSKAEATYVDGRCLFSLEKDTAARQQITKERQRLIQKLLTEKKRSDRRGPAPAAGAADGPRPDGPPAGGRGRRRPGAGGPPPQDETSGSSDDGVVTQDDALHRYLMDLYNRGIDPGANYPGQCGCGMVHMR